MALGLTADENALLKATGAARRWVAEGKREIDREEMTRELSRLNLESSPAQATLLVQEIDRDPWPDAPLVSLDWVDLFEGEEARSRRNTKDPQAWNHLMRPELSEAAGTIRSQGFNDVMVRGALRLPSWFAVGAALADVAGFRVSCVQQGVVWSSTASPSEFALEVRKEEVQQGPEIAVSVSVTTDISRDVARFVKQAGLPVQDCIHVAPQSGPSVQALGDDAAARGLALAVREVVRDAAEQGTVNKIHLFVAAPAGSALLLGHLWNRVPATQLYADTNPGYVPAYLIPS